MRVSLSRAYQSKKQKQKPKKQQQKNQARAPYPECPSSCSPEGSPSVGHREPCDVHRRRSVRLVDSPVCRRSSRSSTPPREYTQTPYNYRICTHTLRGVVGEAGIKVTTCGFRVLYVPVKESTLDYQRWLQWRQQSEILNANGGLVYPL
jgi:hypothetical protein